MRTFIERMRSQETDVKTVANFKAPIGDRLYQGVADGSTITKRIDSPPCSALCLYVNAIAENFTTINATVTLYKRNGMTKDLATIDSTTIAIPAATEGTADTVLNTDFNEEDLAIAETMQISFTLPTIANSKCEIYYAFFPENPRTSADGGSSSVVLSPIDSIVDPTTETGYITNSNPDCFYKEDLLSVNQAQSVGTELFEFTMYPHNKAIIEFQDVATTGNHTVKIYGSNAPTHPAAVADMIDISQYGVELLSGATPGATYTTNFALEVEGWHWITVQVVTATATSTIRLYARGRV